MRETDEAAGRVRRLHWAPDSRLLAVVGDDASIIIWDTSDDTRVTVVTLVPTEALAWSPDGSRVATTGTDGSVRVHDVATGKLLAEQTAEAAPTATMAPTAPLAASDHDEPDEQGHPTDRDDGDDRGATGDAPAAGGSGCVRTLVVPVARIRELIGPKGVVVRSIESKAHCRVDIEDSGHVTITAASSHDAEHAVGLIDQVLNPPQVEAGDIYVGRVATLADYGAFVNILPGRDGLLHVNKLGTDDWIVDIRSVLDVGDEIEVVVEAVLDNGKISLDLVRPLEH